MTIKITKAQLAAMEPCDLDSRLAMFGSQASLTVPQAFKAGFTISDLCWVAGQLGMTDKLVEFARQCATDATSYARADAYATFLATYADARHAANVAAQVRVCARHAAKSTTAAHAASRATYAATAARATYATADATETKAQQTIFVEIFA